MRLIDADAIEYTHAIARSLDDGHNWNELCVTKDEIEDMPTIQPERIKGRWEVASTGYSGFMRCSVCKTGCCGDYRSMKFCPNCGAKMEVTT